MKIVHQVSHSFYRKHPHIEYDEIVAEACLIMIKAIETFDPEKGRSLNSWIGFMIHRNLKKVFADEMDSVEYDDGMYNCNRFDPERIFFFKESLNSLSNASKEVIQMIFHQDISTKKEIKQALRTKGFAWNKIQKAFCELKRFANVL
jgi:DNA-directed RNA polymerase specialized sigma subunit